MLTKIHPEFSSSDDYYFKSNSKDDLKNLKVRSLFFNAKDDILSPVNVLNFEDCIYFFYFFNFLVENNENLFMVLTDQGAHTCWFTGFFSFKRVNDFFLFIFLNFFKFFFSGI